MLFAYTYVPHAMEKMQEFIDFIFYEVWCKAPGNGGFRLELFDAKPELREVIEAFYYSDNKNADFFYGSIERIYGYFFTLDAKRIRRLKWWYASNNNVERLCRNDSGCHATHYSHIQKAFPRIINDIQSFFTGLYDFKAAALMDKVGSIDDHYRTFMEVNSIGKCPFCGLGDIKGVHHTKREAYDHYLPKTLYPFNSINFRNLAPACHECNSTYKLSKDPAHNAAGRRKAFYIYTTSAHAIEIAINLGTSDMDRLTPADIEITFGPAAMHEEIKTWKEVYGIDERYKAKCCDNDAKDWLEQLRILRDIDGIGPKDSLATIQQQTSKAPFANSNFLKLAFLKGCQRAGLFEVMEAHRTNSLTWQPENNRF